MRGLGRSLLCAWVFAAACGPAGADHGTAEAQAPSAPLRKEDAPARNVVDAYLAAQAKLATDDFAGAHAAFERLRTAVGAKALTVSASLRKRLDESAAACVAARDLAAVRAAFSPLTEALLAWLATQPNPLAESLGIARCPMALGKGAKWIQLGTAVKNPYYGKEMLECGSIDARVAPGHKL